MNEKRAMAEELILMNNFHREKWEEWFPNDLSEVYVPRAHLFALQHYAEIGLAAESAIQELLDAIDAVCDWGDGTAVEAAMRRCRELIDDKQESPVSNCEMCDHDSIACCANGPINQRGTPCMCTRPKGHIGDHVACGLYEHQLYRWANE